MREARMDPCPSVVEASKPDLNPSAIVLRGVHKRFGEHHVLKDINLDVARGRTRVILGPSGSGKTVIMKHMIGLLDPCEGEVLVDDEDITKMDEKRMLKMREKFGMVFQHAALFDSMNVLDNVAFPLTEHTTLARTEIEDRVREKLSLVGLNGIEKKFPSELSGGMRKRVGLARAVILDPQFVLYDEPTTGLDPLSTAAVDEMILEAAEKFHVTSVVISHDLGSALRVADDIAVIYEGEIVEDCLAENLRESDSPLVGRFLDTWFGKQ
ncbi:MAG: ABC transporter ATP-binding protein [Myxococcota bacterium]